MSRIVFHFLFIILTISLGANYFQLNENSQLNKELHEIVQEIESRVPEEVVEVKSKEVHKLEEEIVVTEENKPNATVEATQFSNMLVEKCEYYDNDNSKVFDDICYCETIQVEIRSTSWEEYANVLYGFVSNFCPSK